MQVFYCITGLNQLLVAIKVAGNYLNGNLHEIRFYKGLRAVVAMVADYIY